MRRNSLREYSLKLNRAVGCLPPAPCIFPPEGPRRCAHHVMLVSQKDLDSGKANGCSFCNPNGNPGDARLFFMPTHCDEPLNGFNPERANAKQPGACPQCFSLLHFTKKQDGTGDYECAECSTVFRPKLTHRQTVQEAEAAASAA
jgi:hypothetical protein